MADKKIESIEQSEERFRLLVEGVKDYAIFMLDPQGRVASWNAGAERIKGYTAEEVLGRHFALFYPPEAVATGWPERELEMARAEGRFEDEGWRLRKDGSLFWANVVITALWDDHGNLRGFAKVTRDLTERKRIESLESAERRMTEFLAMLAHELRNPLAPIRNAIRTLQMAPLDETARRSSTAIIDRQVTHLARLVDDLLDVSRITSGKIALHREPVEIAALVARAVEASRPFIESRRHSLEIVLPPESLWVAGDQTRLAQVLVNLLNNAAKYTPEGGRIDVEATRRSGEVELRVGDSGIGIPASLLPHVFELFRQGDRALDRTESGLGIGLTLVKRLVRMHGGSVEAASAGPDRGSEFTIRLPLLAEKPARPEPPPGDHPAAHAGPRGALRVLVVDDNRDSAETMTILLRLWGHEVESAATGPAALAIAQGFLPNAVLLDIGLPGIDGYEVARRLRALPGLGGALLLAMTGYGQEHDRRRSREAGFDHHLVKPLEPEYLRQLLAATPAPAERGR